MASREPDLFGDLIPGGERRGEPEGEPSRDGLFADLAPERPPTDPSFLAGLGGGLTESAAGLVGLPGLLAPGEDVFEEAAGTLRERGEELGRRSEAGRITGRIIGEGAQLLGGGVAIGKAILPRLARAAAGRAPGVARAAAAITRGATAPQGRVAATEAGRKLLTQAQRADELPSLLQRLQRLGAESLIFSPVDAAIGLQRSQAEPNLDPVEAVTTELALGAAGGAAFEAFAATARPLARQLVKAREGLARAAREDRPPSPEELAAVENAPLHPSAQDLRARRGAAMASAGGSVPERRGASYLLDPENPIHTRDGVPVARGDDVLLFGRGDLRATGSLSADPSAAPGEGGLFAVPVEMNGMIFKSVRDEGLVDGVAAQPAQSGELLRLPEPEGENFAAALDEALRLKGLDAKPRGPRVLRRPEDFEVEMTLGSRTPKLQFQGTASSELSAFDLPEELADRLLNADGTLRDDAGERFKDLVLPSRETLAKRAPVLYHVTRTADKILSMPDGPKLIAQGRAISLQGLMGARAPAVSFTTDRAEAVMLKREFLRAGKLARREFGINSEEDLIEVLEGFAREDARAAGLSPERTDGLVSRARSVATSVAPRAEIAGRPINAEDALSALTTYHRRRRSLMGQLPEDATLKGLLNNPIMGTDPSAYRNATEETVGIIGLPTRELPDEAAIVRRYNDTLQEVAVFGDVDVSAAQFTGPPRSAPKSAADGLARGVAAGALSPDEIAARVSTRATEEVVREMSRVAPETLRKLQTSGDLPTLDEDEFLGFTNESAERLLGREGGPLHQSTVDEFDELKRLVALSDPEFARGARGEPKTGVTVDEATRKAVEKNSIEELVTEDRLTTPSLVAARNMLRGNIEKLERINNAASQAVGSERERLDALASRVNAASRVLLKLVGSEASEAGLKLRMLREYAQAQRELSDEFWLNEARRILGDTEFAARRGELSTEIRRLINNEDRKGLARLMGELEIPEFGDRLVAYWKAGLLTNPQTHMVNLASNISFAGLERVTEEPAAFMDYVLSKEPLARAFGIEDLPRTTFSPSTARELRSLSRGAALGKELAVAVATDRRPSSPLGQRFFDAKATLENAKVDLRGRTVQFKRFGDPDFIESVARGQPKEAVSAFAHLYVNGVFKALGSADAAFKGVAIDASLVRQARTLAERSEDVTAEGLLREWQEGHRQIPDEVVTNALLEASVRTFQDQTALGKVFAAFQRIPAVGEFIAPFTRVAGALLTRVLEYSGFGLIKGATSLRSAKKALQAFEDEGSEAAFGTALRARRRAVKELARGGTGLGAMAIGYQLADAGLMTGNFPEFGTAERETMEAAGMSERSLYVPAEVAEKVGLPGGWFDVTRIAPAGDVLALGAIAHQQINDPQGDDVLRYMVPMLSSINLIMEQPFAQGLRRVARSAEDLPSAFQSFVLGLSSSAVPFAAAGSGAVARTLDPVVREDEGRAFFRFLTRIPFASETRPPRLNVFGEPIERAPGVVANLLLPGRLREAKDDPVLQELARIKAGVPRLQRRTFTVREEGEDVKKREPLEQYQQRQRLVGQASYRAAAGAINSATYEFVLPALAEQVPMTTEQLRKAYVESEVDRVRSRLFRAGLGSPSDAGTEALSREVVDFIQGEGR